MPILTTGQITDEKGIPTGKWVNQSTGEITDSPPATPLPKPDLGGTYTGPGGVFVPNTPIPTSNLSTPVVPLNVNSSATTQIPNVANVPVNISSEPVIKSVQNPFVKQLEDLMAQVSGKEVEKQARITQQTYGSEKQLRDINTQLAMHQADAMANQEKALASGETLGFASGEAQRVARNDAIETFRLSSIAQALQGNIALATKQAESSVELEFSQKQKDIQTARQNILNNYDTFTNEQKKRADAALLSLNKDDAFVSGQKEDKKTIQGIGIQAATNGADVSIVNKIFQSSDISSAVKNATGYLDKQTEASIQRYNFAKSKEGGNYTGSYSDYLNYEETIKSKAKITAETQSNAKDIAQMIISGDFPPDLTKIVSFRDRTAVSGELARNGYSLTKALQDWTATQKYITTLNSQQQIRMRQATEFAYESLDIIDSLNSELSKSLSRKGINVVNKVEVSAAKQGLYGEEARSIATRFDNQISDLTSELATVYSGGYSSTDDKLKLASQQLSAEWSQKVLTDNVNLVRKNLQIRLNSIKNVGVGGVSNNAYNPQNGNIEKDINLAIHDTVHFPTQQSLIDAIIKEYGISQQEASSKVYSIWNNNIQR